MQFFLYNFCIQLIKFVIKIIAYDTNDYFFLVFGNVGATLFRNVAPLMVLDVTKTLESSWTIVGMTLEGCFF